MTSSFKKSIYIVLAVVSFATFSSAQVISVNFSADTPPFGFGPFYLLGASDTAGVVPVSNWTNFTALVGTVSSLQDDTGSATTASATLTAGAPNYGHWGFYGASGDDQRMLGGFVESPLPTTDFTLTLSNIPYALYDIIVYSGPNADRLGLPWSVSNGSTTYYGLVGDPTSLPSPPFILGNATLLSSATTANYSVFSNLSATSTTLTFGGEAPSLSGIQIVLVPEPSTVMLALLGMAGAAWLVILRRRQA